MRTTTRVDWRFSFTISDLGRLVGKSPVTLRGWEDRGLVTFPRDQSGDRKLGSEDVRAVADTALALGRISRRRANLVHAAMTLVEQIEHDNNWRAKQ